MRVLGIWDGHDSGAALVEDNEVVFAANEERYTRRKLEVNFPYNSIIATLYHAGLKPDDIDHIAFTTTEFTKTLERVFPRMKESYYQFRRRRIPRPKLEDLRHNLKYTMTPVGILPMCGAVSKSIILKRLRHMGFHNFDLHVVEHHVAHAATAAFTSGFKRALVITMDGLGDGLSGSISVLEKGKLERRVKISSKDSVGIMYEQVTNIVGMRELEDEGKVMAMADYSFPFNFDDNKLKELISVRGTSVVAKNNPRRQYSMIRKIGWQMPREHLAYMAQQLLENAIMKLTSNAIDRFGIGDVVFSGGLFSNVKANMRTRALDTLKRWYIFPHMGDGGMALGAALYSNYLLDGTTQHRFGAYLGDSFSEDETESIARGDRSLSVERESPEEQAKHAAELIYKGDYVFWFQDRMEYGPRALGHRSILAPPGSDEVKERLNLYVKRREWFQPFAASMLEGDVHSLVEYDGKGLDRFMTTAYRVGKDAEKGMRSVVHVDNTTRPQMVEDDGSHYSVLLKSMKRYTGHGVVLNTSFNLHGYPIVRDPNDALKTLKDTRTKYLFMNGVTITNKRAV